MKVSYSLIAAIHQFQNPQKPFKSHIIQQWIIQKCQINQKAFKHTWTCILCAIFYCRDTWKSNHNAQTENLQRDRPACIKNCCLLFGSCTTFFIHFYHKLLTIFPGIWKKAEQKINWIFIVWSRFSRGWKSGKDKIAAIWMHFLLVLYMRKIMIGLKSLECYNWYSLLRGRLHHYFVLLVGVLWVSFEIYHIQLYWISTHSNFPSKTDVIYLFQAEIFILFPIEKMMKAFTW